MAALVVVVVVMVVVLLQGFTSRPLSFLRCGAAYWRTPWSDAALLG
jgi:hypothetical protein